ncbi:MAG: hypothetical protein OP8BY_1367 [Candidatus Saccharicenans subterraneus]|uniref:Uncharacterized protein n=1 Tax=Candidatus Saccharicenans subterraneus TaxID=2508984 RepID=A0A3E2BPW9_9BACT|nr:MAG: hypothetical protein OP8BY_1367 [Candidatus Saccharicenans subterraneum]
MRQEIISKTFEFEAVPMSVQKELWCCWYCHDYRARKTSAEI